MRRYSAILFDLDNTLFDYDTASANALGNALTSEGLTGDFSAIYSDYHSINMALWEQLEADEIDLDTLQIRRFEQLGELYHWRGINWAGMSDRYLDYLSREAVLYADTRSTLATLFQEYRLGVLTNGIEPVQRERMARSGLETYFSAFVISSVHGIAKPDPRIFRIALETMDVPARETLYVGDSVSSDMAGAAAAGIDFCWINPHRQSPPSGAFFR